MASGLLLAITGLAGCGDDGGGGSGGGGGYVPSTTSWTFDASDCEDAHFPIPLTVSTTVDEERPYVKNVVACTADEQYGPVWLHNVGGEIWTFADDAKWEFLDFTLVSDVFAAGFDDPAILVPGDKLLIHAPPIQVSWELDAEYTVAWDTQSEVVDRLKSYGEEALTLALKKEGSPARAALTACTLSAYDVANTWGDDPDGFNQNFGGALTTAADATGCASKWETAWSERFKPTATFLETVDTRFRLFSRIGRNVLIAVR